jgi:hypothetical protein
MSSQIKTEAGRVAKSYIKQRQTANLKMFKRGMEYCAALGGTIQNETIRFQSCEHEGVSALKQEIRKAIKKLKKLP